MAAVSPLAFADGTKNRAQYDLAFQISPIFLRNGIVSGSQGYIAPIITFTGEPELADGSDAFAKYLPMPGSSLINQSVGMYPFANQQVAANATIQQPLTISLLMIVPVNQPGGYLNKLSAMSGLQQTLEAHNAAGGLYDIATPAFIYYNTIMTAMTDVSPEITDASGPLKQVQIQYQLDFIQPIVTQQEAVQAYNAFIQRVSNGNQINGTPSWTSNPASNPATFTGQTGSLGNVSQALNTFGGSP